MRLNKPKSIRDITNLKRLKPIPPLSPREEWIRGETVSAISILWLSVHILYETKMLLETNLSEGEIRRRFDTNMLMVKKLSEHEKEGYMMWRDFEEMRKAAGVKERLSK